MCVAWWRHNMDVALCSAVTLFQNLTMQQICSQLQLGMTKILKY